jgi:nucleoside 2-deoxyribosyltransferase
MSNSDEATAPRRFYLATRIDRSAQAAPLLEALTAQGWVRTFVWTGEEIDPDRHADTALKELAGVREADIVIALLPGGRGTHVEIGAALALGKRVILHAPNRDTLTKPYPCVFYYHPSVKLLVSEVLHANAVLAYLPA